MTMRLRIRKNTHEKHNGVCSVWLIHSDSSSIESGMMWGVVSEKQAELLANTLGLQVDREFQNGMVSDDAVERAAENTKNIRYLF